MTCRSQITWRQAASCALQTSVDSSRYLCVHALGHHLPVGGGCPLSDCRADSPGCKLPQKSTTPRATFPGKVSARTVARLGFSADSAELERRERRLLIKSVDDSNQHPFREAPWMRPVPPLEVHALACLPISGNLAALGSPNEVAQVSMY
jgi:hypothetical protein